jgi:hypothetical protein
MTGDEKRAVTAPASAAPSAGCLSDEEVLEYVEGGAGGPEPAVVQAHLARCERCRILVGTAAEELAPAAALPKRVRTLADGERVLERYQIERFIARGGMGEVYLARDTFLGEAVALKTLSITIVDSADAVARFKAEVQLARKVSHANVCRILEFGFHEQRGADGALERVPFLTMELLRGRTLREHLADRGPLPVEEVEDVTRQMVEGLAAIHEAGIVHRDLKSDNVLLVPLSEGPRQRAVLMDFGLARPVHGRRSFSSVGGVVGTMDYLAPEQVQGRPATAASDVYALGIVVYEMLTARLPFEAETSLAATLKRVQEPAPRVARRRPDVPRAWDALVARCLEREPARRYQSAAELRAALAGAPAGARPRAGWRRPLVLGGAIAAALAAAALVRGLAGAPGARPGSPAVVRSLPPPPAPVPVPVPVPPSEPLTEKPPAAAPPPAAATAAPVEASLPKRRRPARPTARANEPSAPVAAPPPPPPEPSPAAPEPEPRRRLRHPDDVSNPFQ